jgi:beta-glucuronidase
VRKPALWTAAVALTIALAPAATAQEPAPPPPAAPVTAPPQRALYLGGQEGRYLLDGQWWFRQDHANAGLGSGFAQRQSLEGWLPVEIPHAWNATDLSDASARGSIGWYRKDFRVPRAARRATWLVRFESVNYRTRVYLNGREIGRHEGAYVPFELPASSIRRGAVNRLVVRVDSRRRNTDIPAARRQTNGRPGGGWWNYGGILREAYLRRVDRVDIERFLARPIVGCRSCPAKLLLRATLRNHTPKKRAVTVRASIEGRSVRLPKVIVPARGSRDVAAVVTIRNPRLWQPGDPQLYTVRANALIGRRPVSSYRTDVGLRSIRVNLRGQMELNGQRVELRGASMHEDSPGRGAALTTQQIQRDVDLLRALNANVTRSHYPLNQQMLEACDRLGILVWEQIPFNRERFESVGSGTLEEDDAIARSGRVHDKALRLLRDTILRDQNHPSVFAWSVANEPASNPKSREQDYFRQAARLVHEMDPSRLAAVDLAGYPAAPPHPVWLEFDAIGLNSYFGWYPGPSGQLTHRDDLPAFLDQAHSYWPTQALFITEFGAEANRGGPVDEKGTYEFQGDLLRYHLDIYHQKNAYINGAIAWILRDFRVQPGWDGGNPKPSPPVLKKGLTDEAGNPKPAFDDVSQMFGDVEPLRQRRR